MAAAFPRVDDGDASALERLTPIVYDELHRLARRDLRGERPGQSLQTTALVTEAYLRLVGYERMQWWGATVPRTWSHSMTR